MNSYSLVRWAGGKNWFIPLFQNMIANLEFNSYFEPFVGGASVYISSIQGHKSFLSDLNAELITTYEIVKNSPELLIT